MPGSAPSETLCSTRIVFLIRPDPQELYSESHKNDVCWFNNLEMLNVSNHHEQQKTFLATIPKPDEKSLWNSQAISPIA
jgi:hypothetical protein